MAVNKEQFFEALLEAAEIFSDGALSNSVFSKILDVIYSKLNIYRSFIFLYDAENDRLRLDAMKNFNPHEFRRFEHGAEKTFVQRVINSGKSVVIQRLSQEATYLSIFNQTADKIVENSIICAPLISQKKVVGAFGIEIETGEKTDFEEYAIFLKILAAMLAQVNEIERSVAKEKEKLLEEASSLHRDLRQKYDFGQIVGNSSAMRSVYNQVAQVARSNTTVLLRGESGTGKELIANAIHYNSLRAKKPLIKVNCAALPETLIEAELFGYEKGAFTGAHAKKKGRFELAEGGTLFLDEIGELTPQTQIKLLRVLQEREFEQLGGTETIKANVRLIAATNKNLEEAIGRGEFREDLFYRLNVFTIFLPPLRERKSDILLLAENFVEKYEREHSKHIKRISTPAIDMLTSYHYPGNVRELENVIERAVLVCDENVIHGHHLPPTLQTAEKTNTIPKISLAEAVEAFERDLIQDALKTTRGNRAKAAKLLDTTERILCYKITKYNIEPRRFKN